MTFNTIPELLDELRAGRMVVIVAAADRENEGDLIMAAALVRPQDINFMVTHARGLVCLSLTRERCRQPVSYTHLDVYKRQAASGTRRMSDAGFAEHFSTVASRYAAARPTYPQALFDWIAALAPARDRAWEAGCGSGQATRGLASVFGEVYATDPSACLLYTSRCV